MAMKAADLLAAASGKTSNIVLGLGQSAEVDALVKDLRIGDRHSRMEMKRLLTAGKITSNTKDDHGCPLLLAACQGGMASLAYDMITSWKADEKCDDEKVIWKWQFARHYLFPINLLAFDSAARPYESCNAGSRINFWTTFHTLISAI